MAHIEDRWFKTMTDDNGQSVKVKTDLHGRGLRYRVRYMAPSGKERSKSFADRQRREAEAFMVTIEADKLKGLYIDPTAGRITFKEYAEKWTQTHAVDESTRELIEQRLRRHVFPFLGVRRLASIKPGDIREWDRSLVDQLAPSTRSVAFAFVRSIFAAAVDDERIAKNPCSAKSVKQPRPTPPQIIPWLPEQVVGVRSRMSERYFPIVDLGVGCGLRIGEITGISVDDLDFADGWVHVQRQIKIVRNRMVFGLPKSKKDRYVPMSGAVAKNLTMHLERFGTVSITLPWERPDSGQLVTVPLILSTTRKNQVKRTTFYEQIWHLRSAGMTPGKTNGPHALRHLYASVLLDAGESIKALAEYLGHADPAFTLRQYTHLMPQSETRTRAAIDDLYGSAHGLATAWRES